MKQQPVVDFSMLLASAAHDMKNSLSLVINTLDEILEQNEQLKQCQISEPLQQIGYEAKRVNSHLVQLLSLYKIEKEHYRPYFDLHPVYDFLDEQLLYFQSTLEFNHIDHQLQCDETLQWVFDDELISGVINNIINNSVRYTTSKILVRAEQRDDYLVIHIEDDGGGYPEKMINGNQPRTSGSLSLFSSNTGLGLYFSEVIAKAHSHDMLKGFIELSNHQTLSGGCFSIHLPRQ